MSEKSSTADDILVAGNAAFPGNGTQFPGAPGNSAHGQPTAADNAGPFPWRRARTTAKSALAAVALMVTALAAFLGTTKPALAAPVPSTGEHGANTGTAVATARLSLAPADDEPCKIDSISPGCESTNRQLLVYSVNTGDTDDCLFRWKIFWDDTTTQIVTDRGGSADERFIIKAGHIYREPRETTTYHVVWVAVSVTGGCTIGDGSSDFTLEVPRR